MTNVSLFVEPVCRDVVTNVKWRTLALNQPQASDFDQVSYMYEHLE